MNASNSLPQSTNTKVTSTPYRFGVEDAQRGEAFALKESSSGAAIRFSTR